MKLSHIGHNLRAAARVETLIIGTPQKLDPHQKQLLDQFSQLRTDYVMQQGWPIHSSGIDVDTYDTAAESYYVMAHVDGVIVAGLRLTNVSSALGSLSYSMWQHAVDRNKFDTSIAEHTLDMEIINQAAQTGHLWDVTRLISASALGFEVSPQFKAESRLGVLMAMAASVSITDNKNSCWIFTASEKAYRFMVRNHFSPQVLAQGVISETDDGETYFCYLNPHDVLARLQKKKPLVHLMAKKTIASHAKK